jgi:hypothetical protein
MWHATYTQVNQGDSWFLVVGSQIGTLTPNPSFSHNLCFKYPNGSCELILDIYVPRNFQWYKELFNSNDFWPLQWPLENLEIHWDSNSQSGNSLRSVWVHSLTLSYTPGNMKCDFWVSFLVHTFASPFLGHKPKAKVTTLKVLSYFNIPF